MEPETARTLRQTLQHLMRDCDRRQELVQELIITNNSLRYDSTIDKIISVQMLTASKWHIMHFPIVSAQEYYSKLILEC